MSRTAHAAGRPRRALPALTAALAACAAVALYSTDHASPAPATTFTVNSTGDAPDASPGNGICQTTVPGECTLRAAIQEANALAGTDTIEFDIPAAAPGCNPATGVCTVTPATPLPTVTAPVTIDGYTQPGASPNTNGPAQGTNAQLKIELNGSLPTGANGLTVAGGNSLIRGLVINRFRVLPGTLTGGNGILVQTNGGNVIEGNFIGTDPTGTVDLGNDLDGVSVLGVANNLIGGTTPAARNLLSGNAHGIQLRTGATQNLVQGNLVGTDASGTARVENFNVGIRLSSSSRNTIGGTTPAARNVISGNFFGMDILNPDSSDNVVRGNFIGTDVTGNSPLGNTGRGIEINQSPRNVIGGTMAGATNVISANGENGITVFLTSDTIVQGNLFGTNASGTAPVGTTRFGVVLQNATGNLVGGSAAGAGNVIARSSTIALWITSGPASTGGNTVQGNFIGTDRTGTVALGNPGRGIQLQGASNNLIGGTAPAERNVIVFSGREGIFQFGGTGNAFLGNSIRANGGMGIDLSPNGPTPNDPGDADTGANDLQNFPVLTSTSSSSGGTTVQGTLNSTPNTQFRLEFFANRACDASLHGEGETFLGFIRVTTDGAGNASFTANVGPGPAGQRIITATATNPANSTSEFSRCVSQSTPATVTLSPPTAENPVGTSHTVTATVRDASGQTMAGILVRFSVSGSVTASGSCTTAGDGTCSFTYQGPPLPGADVITAYADTDEDNTRDAGEPAGAAEKTWTLPASSEFCEVKITQGGWIIAANGDRASFGGNARVREGGSVDGHENYQDHGPAQPRHVQSIELTALTCSEDRTAATIFGRATVDGAGNVVFRIDVTDAGEPGSNDSYGITMSDGYASGQQPLQGGDVQIH